MESKIRDYTSGNLFLAGNYLATSKLVLRFPAY